MRCSRCNSFTVQEIFVDYQNDSGSMSFLGHRCVICGDVVDPMILRHRAGRATRIFSKTRKHDGPVTMEYVGRMKSWRSKEIDE